eukprot:2163443-Amphidinium_carterae.1
METEDLRPCNISGDKKAAVPLMPVKLSSVGHDSCFATPKSQSFTVHVGPNDQGKLPTKNATETVAEEVVWLDIPVNNAQVVYMRHSTQHANCKRYQCAFRVHLQFCKSCQQRCITKLHNHVAPRATGAHCDKR